MKLLLYCTKSKPILYKPFEWDCFPNDEASRFYLGDSKTIEIDEELNGKVFAECDFEVEEIRNYNNSITYYTQSLNQQELLNKSCLDICKLDDYLKGKNGYSIHIKNLHIFDEPKKLNEYYSEYYVKGWGFTEVKLENAPQNMRYCYSIANTKYILISIRPEWLCKILNGEKTIEIRKKVLKEMLNDK